MLKNKLKEIRMGTYYMNQKQFVEFLDISIKSYSSWEKGKIKPSVEVALKISKKLEMNVEDIWSID